MATDAENAATALSQAWARLAELDTVPLDQRARFTHTTSQGISYDWNGYRSALLSQIKDLQGSGNMPGLVQGASGPFEVWG